MKRADSLRLPLGGVVLMMIWIMSSIAAFCAAVIVMVVEVGEEQGKGYGCPRKSQTEANRVEISIPREYLIMDSRSF